MTIQGNYSLSGNLNCSTAQPFETKNNKKRKSAETCLMFEIYLRAYAMMKNVTAKLFLEIINNGPFLI